jgi:hypothetical protein
LPCPVAPRPAPGCSSAERAGYLVPGRRIDRQRHSRWRRAMRRTRGDVAQKLDVPRPGLYGLLGVGGKHAGWQQRAQHQQGAVDEPTTVARIHDASSAWVPTPDKQSTCHVRQSLPRRGLSDQADSSRGIVVSSRIQQPPASGDRMRVAVPAAAVLRWAVTRAIQSVGRCYNNRRDCVWPRRGSTMRATQPLSSIQRPAPPPREPPCTNNPLP